MPRGVVAWFDQRAGEGVIRRDGHEYPVSTADIEPDARVPRARVHFDIRRQEGADRAVNVILRRGTRVAPHQHRFGDMAGAHHPDEKGHHPLTDDHPGSDWSFEGRPVALIEQWADLITLRDLSTLRQLYAPDAVLHTEAGLVEGRDGIVDRLRSDLAGSTPQTGPVRDHSGVISVEVLVGERAILMDFRVAHGRVVEHWARPI